jgi:hypothetical protein
MSLWNPTGGQRAALIARFDEAADNAASGSALLATPFRRWPDGRALADEIRELEHDGDRITHDVVSQLERSFVLPFDREDGHGLAAALDDVVDYIDEAAEHVVIYKVGAPPAHAIALTGLIREATRELAGGLLTRPEQLGAGIRRIDELEHDADRTLRSALSSLFEREVDPLVVLRWKDILARLESAIDSCNEAARVLETMRIKTGVSASRQVTRNRAASAPHRGSPLSSRGHRCVGRPARSIHRPRT